MQFFTEVGKNKKKLNISNKIIHYENGKAAISKLLQKLCLKNQDEVYISTTFDTKYVSSCVTSTIFNFCKPSKVFSKQTRLIFVIHEFGFPNEKVFELKKLAEKYKITLVEDCAQSGDSYFQNNQRIGTVGDYSIYSLKKILPYDNAGLLIKKGQKFPYLAELEKASKIRRNNYKKATKIFRKYGFVQPFILSEKISPYVFVFEILKNNHGLNDLLNNLLNLDLIFWNNLNVYSLPTHQDLNQEYFKYLKTIIEHGK